MNERRVATHDRRRTAAAVTQRRLTGVAVAYLILLLSFALGLWELEQRDIQRTDAVAQRTCERTNHLRAAINDNSLVLYVATLNAIKRERARGADVKPMQEIAKLYVFRPLTDCHRAVYDPRGYTPPKTRAWSKDQIARIKLRTGQ